MERPGGNPGLAFLRGTGKGKLGVELGHGWFLVVGCFWVLIVLRFWKWVDGSEPRVAAR
jgi:hypothetical protein